VNNKGQTPAHIIATNYENGPGYGRSVDFVEVVNACSDLLARGSFITLDKSWAKFHMFHMGDIWRPSESLRRIFIPETLQLIWSLADRTGPQGK
jgi:hypothetical protein